MCISTLPLNSYCVAYAKFLLFKTRNFYQYKAKVGYDFSVHFAIHRCDNVLIVYTLTCSLLSLWHIFVVVLLHMLWLYDTLVSVSISIHPLKTR